MIAYINGTIEMSIFDKDGVEVSEEREQEILKKLQDGSFCIGLASRNINDLENNMEVVGTFEFEVVDGEYEFDKE